MISGGAANTPALLRGTQPRTPLKELPLRIPKNLLLKSQIL
jgi:hypothetical protein